ncbi:helix-turn-helix domain-containing protein [Nonomuraea sp. NPDC026600]|uniref:PucR family transcriptional regulator n=1 Tax=Nonomuraea sp. NPDC026600 TaxID=3155363 RepID=UPI00340568CC
MTASADVQEAVDKLAVSLGHPVLVEDARHRPLWWSAQGEVDGTRLRTIMQREVSSAAAAVVVRLGLPRAQGPVRVPAVPEAEMLPRWCVPLRAGRDLLGYLWVLNGDELVTEADLPRIVACADLAAMSLAWSRSQDDHDRRRAALLARLEAGPDDDAARELIALEQLDPSATVVVQASSAPGGWKLRGGMSAHVNPPAAAGATSGRPVPVGDLHLAVTRATATLQVLRAGAALSRPSWDALGAWHLIVAAPPDLSVADIHPGADVLARQPKPDLMITARAMLDHGGDITRTAAALHIHRTTLYYRLDRIEVLTGVSLRSGPGRGDLHVALRLAAYRAAAR